MKAKILKIESKPSKYSRDLPFYYIFLKSDTGKSYRTCASPIYRNYPRWKGIVEHFNNAKQEEVWLGGLMTKTVKGEEIVDADSLVVIMRADHFLEEAAAIPQKVMDKMTAKLFPDDRFERMKEMRKSMEVKA